MQAAIDRVMQTYGLLVNLTADQEQVAREKVSSFLASAHTDDENKLAVEGYLRRSKMKKLSGKPTDQKCVACNGTGFPVVTQPVQPNRKIYPAPCKTCAGKGRVEAANSSGA